jgi:hypothetical protein
VVGGCIRETAVFGKNYKNAGFASRTGEGGSDMYRQLIDWLKE